jgi:3-methyladenine DNA glycosylase AlkD
VVEVGADCLVHNNSDLGNLWLHVVEAPEVVVTMSSTTKNLRQTNTKKTSGKEVDDLEKDINASLRALAWQNTDAIRSVRRNFSQRLAESPPELIVALALKLTQGSHIVPRFFAYELIQHHSQALQSLGAKSLERLGQGNDSWEKVDAFACYVAGPVWRQRQVSDSLIQRWARSRDRWWRRTALVSTVPLNNKARGGSGDSDRTLMICGALTTDRDDMVVKALSWALRELSKRDPESVRNFLQERLDEVAPRVAREVNSKLKTGLKNPRVKRT